VKLEEDGNILAFKPDMKNTATITSVVLLLFSLLIIGACKKERENPEDLLHKWQVISMRRPNSSSQQYPVGTYILRFKTAGSLSFKLDVNSCEGEYAVSEPGQIKINSMGCTEICCDSNLAQELAAVLHHVSTYTIQENILTLSGSGEIKLKGIK
jgi:heat shock protein HslJ